MKTTTLLLRYLVAFSAVLSAFLLNVNSVQSHEKFSQHPEVSQRILNSQTISLCFEDLTDPAEGIQNLPGRSISSTDFESVEKIQTIFTKVSFKHLVVLHSNYTSEDRRYLDLQRMVI